MKYPICLSSTWYIASLHAGLECTFVSPLGLVDLRELDLERTTVGDNGLDVLACTLNRISFLRSPHV